MSDLKFFFECNLEIAARRRFKELKKKNKKTLFKDVKKALRIRNNLDTNRKHSPLLKHRNSIVINTGKLSKSAMLAKMSKYVENILNKNENETEINTNNSLYKEFQNLLDQDFKNRKLKENEITTAIVTEITKNFIIVDCKAKMEGMIAKEEFGEEEISNIKIGSKIEVFLERIESFKGEIIISRDKARKIKAWKKMEKVFESQEEMTGYITGKVKEALLLTLRAYLVSCPLLKSILNPKKSRSFNEYSN